MLLVTINDAGMAPIDKMRMLMRVGEKLVAGHTGGDIVDDGGKKVGDFNVFVDRIPNEPQSGGAD